MTNLTAAPSLPPSVMGRVPAHFVNVHFNREHHAYVGERS